MPPDRDQDLSAWFIAMAEQRRRFGLETLYLGGSAGSGGGIGGPPGGFVGQLAQSRSTYDTDELGTSAGSGSLVDNLNHIRARLSSTAKFTNKSGASTYQGDVVSLYSGANNSYRAPTGASDLDVLGVVVDPVIASDGSGYVNVGGYCSVISVDAQASPGDYLYPSAVPKKAHPSSSGSEPGCFGRAMSSGSTFISGLVYLSNRILSSSSSFTGSEAVLVSDLVDLTGIGTYDITVPTGFSIYADEVGVVAIDVFSPTGQPTFSFGIVGDNDKHLTATTATAFTLPNRRNKYTALVPEDGETAPTFTVISAGSAAQMTGRAYYKGVLMQTSAGSTPFSPLDISGMRIWTDFSDTSTLFQDSGLTTPVTTNADPIGGVVDKSGNANDATQSTSGSRPTYRTAVQNGRSVGRFDGSNDFLSIGMAGVSTGLTVFMVAKRATASAYILDGITNNQPGIISGFDPGSGTQAFEYYDGVTRQSFDASSTGFHLVSFRGNGGTLVGRFDGTQIFSVAPTSSLIGMAINTIGDATGGGAPYNADFAEMIVYDGYLSDTEMGLVEAYLSDKWGL